MDNCDPGIHRVDYVLRGFNQFRQNEVVRGTGGFLVAAAWGMAGTAWCRNGKTQTTLFAP